MTSTASGAPPGARPWALASQVQDRLDGLAAGYDVAAQRLDGVASRCAALTQQDGWSGPGSRAFAARVGRHGEDVQQEAERCREVAGLLRTAGTLLAQRIQGAESLLDLGGALTGMLTTVLGPGAAAGAAVVLP